MKRAFIHDNFPRYLNISLDYGILEKVGMFMCDEGCDFGWADLGTLAWCL